MNLENENSLQPPSTDRGVETPTLCINTGLKPVDVVIDWFQCTIQGNDVEDVVKAVFHTSLESCLHTPSGRFGYNNTYTYAEKIHIMYHDLRCDMGVHIMLSGSACRELEDLLSWKDFFERIISFPCCKVTRIDIAIDTYKKFFDIAMLRKKISDSELVSKFRKGTYMEQINISGGSQESASLKFGSMSSDIYIVFYDKLAERKNAGYTVDDSIDFWIRTELRFKHDLAVKLLALIITNDYEVGSFIYEILYSYIDFKEYNPYDLEHKYRWETSPFWINFLGVVGKLSIATKAQQTTIQRKKNYAEKQLSKTLAMLRIVENDFYDDMFKKGYSKITNSDLEIINAHLISQNIAPLTNESIHEIYKNIVSQNDTAVPGEKQTNEIHEQLTMKEVCGWKQL